MKVSEAIEGHGCNVELEDGEEQEVLCDGCLQDLADGTPFVICGVSGEPVAAFLEPCNHWEQPIVRYHWLDYFDQYQKGVMH